MASVELTASAAVNLSLNPDLDRNDLARIYAQTGRVRIYGLLAEGALELHDHLRTRSDWVQVVHAPGAPIELTRSMREEMGPEGYAPIEEGVISRGRSSFQYRYEAIRLPNTDEEIIEWDLLGSFSSFLHSAEMSDLIYDITGSRPGAFVNGQATSYGAGDFLTGHDDDVVGDHRMAAFVLGLTKFWRLEWGGLLLFHGCKDRTADALVPRFNTLDLFSVPQQHSVSYVSPIAGFSRLALTGWYRSSTPEVTEV